MFVYHAEHEYIKNPDCSFVFGLADRWGIHGPPVNRFEHFKFWSSPVIPVTGGWVPYGDEATLNQIIQLYLWVLFASIPIIIQLILQSQWISSCLSFGFIFLIVLLIKLICYNLHKVFDTNEANQLTVPEMIPAWFALRNVFKFLIHSGVVEFEVLIHLKSRSIWVFDPFGLWFNSVFYH